MENPWWNCAAGLRRLLTLGCGALVIGMAPGSVEAAPPLDEALVRESEAQEPAEELVGFEVPEGFSVNLFAAEPMINKPINLAFDERGRMWVTSNTEYPFAAVRERWVDEIGTSVRDSRDSVRILTDSDGDGVADEMTIFADGLNVPTGVLPYRRPGHKAGCIVWSIPNIWYLADTDGDDRADFREILFGPLGWENDVHGNCSSFRVGPDGWIYGTHGFNNTSHFRVREDLLGDRKPGDPGTAIDVHSGNVYRFRPDGSEIEVWSRGQVNPFGLAWDQAGNLYSADCHSAPIYLLQRGAIYPSFGKPHEGLGYGPEMMRHNHSSTGICGITMIDGGMWGPEWDGLMLIGNVVTSRINADRIIWHGSSAEAIEQPDFLSSRDPWFRPVDMRMGPDGALYIADFYNRIIGHYEVPVTHPGRDRERGRIWRISRDQVGEHAVVDDGGVLAGLASANPQQRQLASQRVIGGAGEVALPEPLAGDRGIDSLARLRLHGLLLATGKAGPGTALDRLAAKLREDPVARQLVLRQTAEFGFSDPNARADALETLANDPSWPVRRAAAEAFQLQPGVDSLAALVRLSPEIPDQDPMMQHTWKLAMREHFRDPDVLAATDSEALRAIPGWQEILLATATPQAATRMMREISAGLMPEQPEQAAKFIARYAPGEEIAGLVETIPAEMPVETQVKLLEAAEAGLVERGDEAVPASWRERALELALRISADQPSPNWRELASTGESPFGIETRPTAGGGEVRCLTSLALHNSDGEKRTGVLRSQGFEAPDELVFQLAGHSGNPENPPHDLCRVQLADAETGEVLMTALPPRSETAVEVKWDLRPLDRRRVVFEVIDLDSGLGWAWVAVGGFQPEVIRVADFPSDREMRLRMRGLASLAVGIAPAAARESMTAWLPLPADSAIAPEPLPSSPEQIAALDQLIAERAAAWKTSAPDKERGETIFNNYCAVCHQIDGVGSLVGPQLDGIGQRGATRLLEDILDPSRNVDSHFRLNLLTLKDGGMAAGMVRGKVGAALLLVDAAGIESRVAESEIETRRETLLSPMPAAFGAALSEGQMMDLLEFLGVRRAE